MHATVQSPTRSNRKDLNISTPLKAIRAMCLEYVGYHVQEVTACTGTDYTLYPFRMGKISRGAGSRLKAKRRHCKVCMGGTPGVPEPSVSKLIAECPSAPGEPECQIFECRFGKNPKLKGVVRGASKKASAGALEDTGARRMPLEERIPIQVRSMRDRCFKNLRVGVLKPTIWGGLRGARGSPGAPFARVFLPEATISG